jgi:hypothetical protein
VYFSIISITSINYEHHIIILSYSLATFWDFGNPLGSLPSASTAQLGRSLPTPPAPRGRQPGPVSAMSRTLGRRSVPGDVVDGRRDANAPGDDVPWCSMVGWSCQYFSYNISYILIIMIINPDYLTILNSANDCHGYIWLPKFSWIWQLRDSVSFININAAWWSTMRI